MAQKPPAYQHYAKDWLADTAHLSLEEQGAYQRLLDHQWLEGPLELDTTDLQRRLGVSAPRFRRLWARLARFFPALPDGRVANGRLERVRADLLAFLERQEAAGRKGAAKRWARHGDPIGDPNGRTIALQSASPPAGTTSEPTVPADAAEDGPPEGWDRKREGTWNAQAAKVIRAVCYAPDGVPPAGCTIGEDLRWWRVKLAKGENPERIEAAIRGAARVAPQLGRVKWSPARWFSKNGEWADLYERSLTASGKRGAR